MPENMITVIIAGTEKYFCLHFALGRHHCDVVTFSKNKVAEEYLKVLSEMKKNTFQSQHVSFFLRKLHKFERKTVFRSVGAEHCFSP